MSDLGTIFLLSLLAMFNPTLLAAVTLMLLTENPKRLMLGYLLGAYTASITVGLAIVFALHDSDAVSTSKQTIGPVEDLVIGALLLLVAYVLATDRARPLRERRERRKEAKQAKNGGEKKEPLPMRLLGRGSPRIAFVVGLLLSFPGVSYLTGLSHIDKLGAATVPTALLVIAFCLIQQSVSGGATHRLRPQARVGPGRRRRLPRLARPQWPPGRDNRRDRARRPPRSSVASPGW